MADDSLTAWTLPAETKEFVGPITVTADGAPVTTFQCSVTQGSARPVTWVDALALDDGYGVMVGVGTGFPLTVGQKYTVWTKFTDNPEVPVQRVGTIRCT